MPFNVTIMWENLPAILSQTSMFIPMLIGLVSRKKKYVVHNLNGKGCKLKTIERFPM